MREPYGSRLKPLLAIDIARAGDVVLDVGCGSGGVVLALAEMGVDVTGLDLDAAVVDDLSRRLGGTARAVVGDATELPFADHCFDVVLCYSTLSVVPNPEKAITEIARVLRPGGRGVIEIKGAKNANHTHWRSYYAARGIKLSAATITDARRLLASHGLRVDAMHGYGLTRAAYYLPILKDLPWIEELTHRGNPDLDFKLSNLKPLIGLAASWYFVVTKA